MNTLTYGKKTKTLLISLAFAISAVFTTSCGGDGDNALNMQIPGVKGPTLTLNDDTVLISMVFENLIIDGGLRYNIPEYDDSYIELGPDLESDGTLMSINVRIADIFGEHLKLLPAQSLPGGRNLPSVASGKLPAVAFSIQALGRTVFYVGPKVFGFFMPTKMDIGTNNIVSARYYSGKFKAGVMSLVGPDENGENSGFALFLDLSKSVKRALKRRM